ncbi:MAG: hypothetical protein WC248_08005 [Candidatus Methanomethylophilaceae archaeon]|jgi:hypothetical protein
MLDTNDYKINVSKLTQKERRRLQKNLFLMGCQWRTSGKFPKYLDANYIFVNNHILSYGTNEYIFDIKSGIILNPYDIISEPKATIAPQDISLRDYFAGLALCGNIACSTTEGNFEDFARYAYRYADAMLKERSC